MARRPRLSGEDTYHHIYAWGNNRHAIFCIDRDYQQYLCLLERYCGEYRIEMIAYALLQTHVHLFLYDQIRKVSQFMNSLHGEYAQYFNRVTGSVGHVFGERFNNKIVQANEYGLWLSRYIHRQAVEAGIVTDAKAYPWTSYHYYLGEKPAGFLNPTVVLAQFGDSPENRRNYVEFVNGSNNGPVDWDARSPVVGSENFQRRMRERSGRKEQKNLTEKQVHELIMEHFDVNPQLLSTPSGLNEKRLRRKVLAYLVEEVGLSQIEVRRLFRISHMTMCRAMSQSGRNGMPVPEKKHGAEW